MGKFRKGNPGGPGRPKGSKNKFSTLKDSYIQAYLDSGGVKALVKWVKESPRNRSAFYQFLIRLVPQNQLTIEEQKNLILNLELGGSEGERVMYQISEKFIPKPESAKKPLKVLDAKEVEIADVEPLSPTEIDKKIEALKAKKAKLLAELEAKLKRREH